MAYESFFADWKDKVFHYYVDVVIIDNKLHFGFYEIDKKEFNFHDSDSFSHIKSPKKEEKFKNKVYRLVKNNKGGYAHDLSLFKYLENMGFIDATDYSKLAEIRIFRHKLVHELLDVLYDDELSKQQDLFRELIRIRKKVNENWIRKVEIPIAIDDFLDRDGNFIPPDEVISIQDLIFDIIYTALGVSEKE